MLESALRARLAKRQAAHLWRTHEAFVPSAGANVRQAVASWLSFCSNDYLGLAQHPGVIRAGTQGLHAHGCGSGSSSMITGYHPAHIALEAALAEFMGKPRVLLFSCGYMANLAAITGLCGRNTVVLEDRLNHASLIDAVRLAKSDVRRYPHKDVSAVRTLLSQRGEQALVVTDGLFSMDGDSAPLVSLSEAVAPTNSWLIVDDSHGVGMLGERGAGSMEAQGIASDAVQVITGSFGKAFGTQGAFVAADTWVIEALVQLARPYMYSTAMPAAMAVATLASLRIMQQETWRRDYLHYLIKQFRRGATQLGLSLLPSDSAIQGIILGDAQQAAHVSDALRARGILVKAMRPPTVPENTSRLRINLTVNHTAQHIDALLTHLDGVLNQS